MRGMSLPIETIVIVAIAVLVLVVIAVFFVGSAGTQLGRISDQDALTRGCTDFAIRYNCNATRIGEVRISGYNTTCGGQTGNTLTVACCKSGFTTPATCAQSACRCPAP